MPFPCNLSQQKNQDKKPWAQELSNVIPLIRIGNHYFLAGVENTVGTGACLPSSVAGAREVYPGTCCPNPAVGLLQAAISFLFLCFDHSMHVYMIVWVIFTSQYSLPTLLNPSGSSQVPLCSHVLVFVGSTLLSLGPFTKLSLGRGLFTGAWETYQWFQHWRKCPPCPSPPAPVSCPGGCTSVSLTSLQPGPTALYQQHYVFGNSRFKSSLSWLVVF